MIRTVTAVALTVAILAISVPAVEHGAAINAENKVETQVAAIDQTAVELVEEEDVPPYGVAGARRLLTLTFPSDSIASQGVENVSIERVDGEQHSIARFRVEGRAQQVVHIDAPIVDEDGNAVVLGRLQGEHTYALTLERGPDGDALVRFARA